MPIPPIALPLLVLYGGARLLNDGKPLFADDPKQKRPELTEAIVASRGCLIDPHGVRIFRPEVAAELFKSLESASLEPCSNVSAGVMYRLVQRHPADMMGAREACRQAHQNGIVIAASLGCALGAQEQYLLWLSKKQRPIVNARGGWAVMWDHAPRMVETENPTRPVARPRPEPAKTEIDRQVFMDHVSRMSAEARAELLKAIAEAPAQESASAAPVVESEAVEGTDAGPKVIVQQRNGRTRASA